MRPRYEVWGYRDDRDDCVKERKLGASHNKAVAIKQARQNPLATCVIDRDTDKEIWTHVPSAGELAGLD